MNVLNGMSISEIGALVFAINTIVMGALGLLVSIHHSNINCVPIIFSFKRKTGKYKRGLPSCHKCRGMHRD